MRKHCDTDCGAHETADPDEHTQKNSRVAHFGIHRRVECDSEKLRFCESFFIRFQSLRRNCVPENRRLVSRKFRNKRRESFRRREFKSMHWKNLRDTRENEECD